MKNRRIMISRLKVASIFLLAFGSTHSFAQTPMSPAALLQQNNATIINGVIPSQLNSMLGNMIVSASATFNVTGYGATCNAVKNGSTWTGTDDTTAFQKAITAASTGPIAGGSTAIIQIPAANCLISGSLAVTASGVIFQGQGSQSSQLVFQNTSNDGLLYAGTYSPYASINGDGLYGITLTGAGKTGGNLLNLEAVYLFKSDDVILNNVWNGLLISSGSNNVTFNRLYVLATANGNPTVGAYGIKAVQTPSSPTNIPINVQVVNINNSVVNLAGVGSYGMDCMDVDGYVGTINFNNITMLQCNYSLRVTNSAHSTVGAVPSFFQANLFASDGVKSGVSIETGFHYSFANSIMDNTTGTTSTYAFQVLHDAFATTQPFGIIMSSTKIFNCPGSCAYLNGDSINIVGSNFSASNSAGTASFPDIVIGPNAKDVTIGNSKIGVENGDTAVPTYSVSVQFGATTIQLDNNNYYENGLAGQTAAIQNSAGLGNVAINGGINIDGNIIGPTVQDLGTTGVKTMYISNAGTVVGTNACLQTVTGSTNAYTQFCENDGATPASKITLGAGSVGGFTIDASGATAAPIALKPNANVDLVGTIPTLTSCGTGSPSLVTGSDGNHGTFTMGTGAPTACTVNFAVSYPNRVSCTVTPGGASAAAIVGGYYISTQSQAGFTLTLGTGTSSAIFNYACFGN